jgi:hypothetical protein
MTEQKPSKSADNYDTKFREKSSATSRKTRTNSDANTSSLFGRLFARDQRLGIAIALFAALIFINVFGWLLGIFAKFLQFVITLIAFYFLWKYFRKGKK